MRHVRMLGLGLATAFAASAVAAGSALAEQNVEQYKKCPLQDPLVESCTYGHTFAGEGGQYTVGGITVPITNSIVLQGGFYETEGKLQFVLPTNGQAVVPTPETVPGEPLANVTPAEQKEFGWPATLQKKYENARITGQLGPGTTTEVIETAGIPELNLSSILFQEGTGIVAPIKIVGKNKFLESTGGKKTGNCRIGSSEHPIVQHLTTGTSTSPLTGETIGGRVGTLSIEVEGSLVGLSGVVLVDNTYPVPGAVGCGGPVYERYLDPVVDRAFGLPAAAGANVTELVGELDAGVANYIRKHL